jgi:antitoxin MazE
MTITRIKKWGNSYGIRIPKENMEELGIRPDDMVEIHSELGHLTITPVQKPKYTLDGLLAQMTPENLHDEIQTGKAIGAEIW